MEKKGKSKSDEAHIYSDVKIWDSFDQCPIKKKKEEVDRMESKTKTDVQQILIQEHLMRSRDENLEENLGTIPKTLKVAAGEAAHCTKSKKETIVKRTPESVRKREEAAANCTKAIKKRVLKQQARKTRAEHLDTCSLAPGRRKVRRKPSELYVNGNFAADREERYADHDEPKEVQEKRVECFKKKGEQQFTDEGRKAEITIDLVVQARAKMSDNKINGPEDAVASEMIKHVPLEKIYIITMCFQERFMGQMEAPSLWKIV